MSTKRKSRQSRSKLVYYAFIKRFHDRDKINAQYKYFNRTVIQYIKNNYQNSHLQQNIEIDKGFMVIILIVSNSMQHKNPSNPDDYIIIKSKRSLHHLLDQMYDIKGITYSDMKYICDELGNNKTIHHQIRKPSKYTPPCLITNELIIVFVR